MRTRLRARRSQARALAMDRSKSLERRRQRRSHPKVCSTTQRRDMTTTPLGVPGFSDDLHSDRAIRFLERACQLVATEGAGGKHDLHRVLTSLQRQQQETRASRSWICSGWTWAASVTLIVLPASSPHPSLPASTVGPLRLSMMAALGSALRPDRSRSSVVKQAQTCSRTPDRDHAWK